MKTHWRGSNRQLDFHCTPVVVKGGDESLVFVEKGRASFSKRRSIVKVRSFLGVMPADIVEMAVDVVSTDDDYVIYSRSIHKENEGIYDAWHTEDVWCETKGVEVVVTCRVNDTNREGKVESLFEGLVRLEFEDA